MADETLAPQTMQDDDDESFVGQIGYIFGAISIAALVLALGAFFALGGIRLLAFFARLVF